VNEAAGIGAVLSILLVVAVILWIILPFAVFGIKGHLVNITFELREARKEAAEFLAETRRQREELERLTAVLTQAVRRPAASKPPAPQA
jgi:hypothetical protein